MKYILCYKKTIKSDIINIKNSPNGDRCLKYHRPNFTNVAWPYVLKYIPIQNL